MENSSNMKITSEKGVSFNSAKRGVHKKTDKDFRKILGREKDGERERSEQKESVKSGKDVKGSESFDEVAEKLEEWEKTSSKSQVSLFELAKSKESKAAEETSLEAEEELPIQELSDDLRQESLSALFKGYGSKERLKALQQEVQSGSAGKKSPISSPLSQETQLSKAKGPMQDFSPDQGRSVADMSREKGHSAAKFAQEQGDLSSVNPFAGMPAQTSSPTSQVQNIQQTETIALKLKEIIDQIIDKLYTLKTSGRTDTLIKLQHPPLFAGSKVVISSFDSAKGEFNITFENLTQAAKQLLDMQENQNALKFALNQKGYTVHIITATTLSETLEVAEGRSPERGEKEKGEEHPGSGNKEQEQEHE